MELQIVIPSFSIHTLQSLLKSQPATVIMPLRRVRLAVLSVLSIVVITLILHRKWVRRLWETNPPEVQFPASILPQELESLTASPPTQVEFASWRSKFNPGSPYPPGTNYTKTIVVPKLKSEDISWMEEELSDIPKAVYGVDDRHASLRPPKNKGHEAMVYLSYIIDHYDMLPDISIFTHAHRWAWHNNDLLDKDSALVIRSLNPERVVREGYMNLRCQWYPGCPAWLKTHTPAEEKDQSKEEEVLVQEAWRELWPGEKMPDFLAQACCSQFAVSRERIVAQPKGEYERLRDWLLRTKLRDSMSGRIFEYVWQWIWKGESAYCPSAEECYCDGFGVCFENSGEFEQCLKMRYQQREDDWDWIKWQIQGSAYQHHLSRGNLEEAERVEKLGEEEMMEFRMKIDVRWFELWDKMQVAVANGKDPIKRAQILERLGGR